MIDLLPYLDVTRLEHDLTDQELLSVLNKSHANHVAAVCVAPENIKIACQVLEGTSVKVASVFNFPLGIQSLIEVEDSISWAINEGVEECDVVLPLNQITHDQTLAEQKARVAGFVKAVRSFCPKQVLKIIIATDILNDVDRIKVASEGVVAGQADFIKTCTGKGAGATAEAVAAIVEVMALSATSIGIKVSGGVKTVAAAKAYYEQVKEGLGVEKLTAKRFRIGASRLLEEIVDQHL